MMNTKDRSGAAIFWGLALVAIGAVLLALTLGLVPNPTGAMVGWAFVLGGLAVLASCVVLRAHWWTLLAGPSVAALGAVILLPGQWGGTIFLGGIGLGFVLVALTSAERWWAVIPAGTLLTLSLVALIGNAVSGLLSGAVLFFGLAVTFGVLVAVPVHGRAMRWPVYPAVGCLLFGLLIATSGAAGELIWPLALVALGVFLLIRAWSGHARPPQLGA